MKIMIMAMKIRTEFEIHLGGCHKKFSKMTKLESKRELIRKLEGQSRRSTLLVSGVPERTEETHGRKSSKKQSENSKEHWLP